MNVEHFAQYYIAIKETQGKCLFDNHIQRTFVSTLMLLYVVAFWPPSEVTLLLSCTMLWGRTLPRNQREGG